MTTHRDEDVLKAASSGACYLPATDDMYFPVAVPDEFPYLDLLSLTTAQVQFLATVIEEFIHRVQLLTTQVGFVYRLASLVQARRVFDLMHDLVAHPAITITAPVLEAHVSDDEIEASLDGLRALEVLRRALFGLSLGPSNIDVLVSGSLRTAKEELETATPVTLGHFHTFGGFSHLYDDQGRVRGNRTTRSILESHASAYAFALLGRHRPGR